MILCKLGIHHMRPTKVFRSIYHSECGEDYLVSSLTGHVCARCHLRKIRKGKFAYLASVGERQDAYDWLNTIESPRLQEGMLELVKR